MEVVEARSGRSWIVREAGRELGVIVESRPGRHPRIFFAAFSAAFAKQQSRYRYDLAAHSTLEAAVARIVAFDEEPERYLDIVHRVGVEAVEKRR